MTRSSSATKRQGGKRKPAVSKANPEFVAFLAGLFGQMSHAADLVIAFFRQHGMLNGSGLAPVPMPSEFLLELAALLQFREWHQAGVSPWNDADGLTINDLIADAVGRLGDDPSAVQSEGRGMQSMVDMQNLSDLLGEKPDVQDVDGAVALPISAVASRVRRN